MDGSLVPVDGSSMPVDAAGASSGNATGSGVRMFAPSANAQYNRTLMNSLQLYNTAIFAFGNDAAIRSEAEALHQAAVTHCKRKTVRSSVPHRISCMHTTLNVCKPSRIGFVNTNSE